MKKKEGQIELSGVSGKKVVHGWGLILKLVPWPAALA